jgi:hypothetical protein
MIISHKKGDNVPQEWYEITKGKKENPFFTLIFSQDCESMVVSGRRNIRPVGGEGYSMKLFNAVDMELNFIDGGINFITPTFQDSLPPTYGATTNA